MKIIIVFILIVIILSLCLKLYQGGIKEHFSFRVEPRLATMINNKLNSNLKNIEKMDTKVKDPSPKLNKVLKVDNEIIPKRRIRPRKRLIRKRNIQNDNADAEPEIQPETENSSEVEINTIRNRRKMIKKSLKNLNRQRNIDYTLANVPYYKPDFEPNTRLEKTDRPNGYEFINKDNVEPNVREISEIKSGYKHIKPGKNLFTSYGYSYMPPEVWSVPQDRPPVCIPQKGFKAEALPVYTKGTPLDALEIEQTLMPKFKYEEVYDPKYYYPGWKTK